MSNLAAGSPRLLLAVSFGTSFADTREKTIGAIEKCIEKRHPDCTVRRCFTSRFIRKKLQERDGLYIAGPEDAIRDAYALAAQVHFDNAYCRKDIGQRALRAVKGV